MHSLRQLRWILPSQRIGHRRGDPVVPMSDGIPKILRIDLTSGDSQIEPASGIFNEWMGGTGVGTYLFSEEIKKLGDFDPLAPESADYIYHWSFGVDVPDDNQERRHFSVSIDRAIWSIVCRWANVSVYAPQRPRCHHPHGESNQLQFYMGRQ